MIDIKRLFSLGALLAVAACTTLPSDAPATTAETATPPPVETVAETPPETPLAPEETRTILISIDGFRADYLDRGVTPEMSALAEGGARAAMRPSFPSKTFPNHYTLVTGLRPDHHGIINNTMEDPDLPGIVFRISDMRVAGDPKWWDEGEPLWVTAENQGVASATMFWPGSDYAIRGVRPGRYERFDQKLTDFARVDILLSWLDVPADEQPRFMTLYFDVVDTAGHLYGPDSPKTTSAAAQVDAAIGRLVDGLAERGLLETTNIVIVADHGMSAVSDDRIIKLDAEVSPGWMHVVWTGAFAGLTPMAGYEDKVESMLIGRTEHGECWRKEDLPARFAYGSNPRVPAIICLADPGWRYETDSMRAWRGSGGDHGYDPADPVMYAIFIANGPAFREGVTLNTFDNVSVYPMLAQLIGVDPAPNDGDIADVEDALK